MSCNLSLKCSLKTLRLQLNFSFIKTKLIFMQALLLLMETGLAK